MSHAANTVVSVNSLDVTVAGRELLNQVEFDLRAGELLVVVGCNGAGKSTLLKHISGELSGRGDIRLFDQRIERQKLSQLAKKRAVLAQQTRLSFGYEVEEVVLLGRIPHQSGQVETQEDRQIARAALERVGLSALANRNYLTLSGGEQQRVHLARVLAQLGSVSGDRLLLLDEPTSSLDLAYQHAVLRLARELGTERVGVMAVLHDLNLASQYATRVLVLADGKVLSYGTPREVLTPETVRAAFGHDVLILEHPTLGYPLVVSAN